MYPIYFIFSGILISVRPPQRPGYSYYCEYIKFFVEGMIPSFHVIDDKRYFGELQFICYPQKYGRITEDDIIEKVNIIENRLSKSDDIMIISVFLDVAGEARNDFIDSILSIPTANFLDLGRSNTSYFYEPGFNLTIPAELGSVFYYYQGQAEIFRCLKNVGYYLAKKPLNLTSSQRSDLAWLLMLAIDDIPDNDVTIFSPPGKLILPSKSDSLKVIFSVVILILFVR